MTAGVFDSLLEKLYTMQYFWIYVKVGHRIEWSDITLRVFVNIIDIESIMDLTMRRSKYQTSLYYHILLSCSAHWAFKVLINFIKINLFPTTRPSTIFWRGVR